ncbi:MAG: GNAT family N-acetyltransferase [Flavobacteriia bacterium]|nr:GNAT family N-acetyltransferase [Flavobacteriia bacterium]
MKRLESERAYVRPLRLTDLDGFAELEANPNVVKYTGYPTATREEAEKDLHHIIRNYSIENPDKLIWAVIRKTDDAFLGTIALVPFEENVWEIGYRFLERHWGNGYAGEILPVLFEWGFSYPNITAIYAEADVKNLASTKILGRHMKFIREVENSKLNCVDRQYFLRKEDWKSA